MVSFYIGSTAVETADGEHGLEGWSIMCKVDEKRVKTAVRQTENKEEARERKIRKVREVEAKEAKDCTTYRLGMAPLP